MKRIMLMLIVLVTIITVSGCGVDMIDTDVFLPDSEPSLELVKVDEYQFDLSDFDMWTITHTDMWYANVYTFDFYSGAAIEGEDSCYVSTDEFRFWTPNVEISGDNVLPGSIFRVETTMGDVTVIEPYTHYEVNVLIISNIENADIDIDLVIVYGIDDAVTVNYIGVE